MFLRIKNVSAPPIDLEFTSLISVDGNAQTLSSQATSYRPRTEKLGLSSFYLKNFKFRLSIIPQSAYNTTFPKYPISTPT